MISYIVIFITFLFYIISAADICIWKYPVSVINELKGEENMSIRWRAGYEDDITDSSNVSRPIQIESTEVLGSYSIIRTNVDLDVDERCRYLRSVTSITGPRSLIISIPWLYRLSRKNMTFCDIFSNGWEFLVQILHARYTFLSTLEYKFLFNYLQLWRIHVILSATTQREFRVMDGHFEHIMVVALNVVKVADNWVKICSLT